MEVYGYYPGCSNKSSSKDYEQSTLAVAKALEVKLKELEDWNCCGTTGATSANPKFSLLLCARNLALAEAEGFSTLVVTCNSCFGMLRRANEYYHAGSEARAWLGKALAKINRKMEGKVAVRHFLDILVNDYGVEKISAKVRQRLEGLKVAPYYGCLIGRPKNEFDDSEFPTSLDRLLEATGAEVVPFDHKSKCCGGALMTTKEDVALRLCEEIFHEAQWRGAQVIAVTCPMCQLNLDAYQDKLNAKFGTRYVFPTPYFTQLLGLALGIGKKELGWGKSFVPFEKAINF